MRKAAIFGVCGWKNSGKTTLTCRLVEAFRARGLRVATVKHAHHAFEIDRAGTDSFKHRESGASEVAIVSRNRWAMIREIGDQVEPTLSEVLSALSPCDIVLIEGYKDEPHPKIETVRTVRSDRPPIWKSNRSVVALATEDAEPQCPLPCFSHDSVEMIADFITQHLGLETGHAAE